MRSKKGYILAIVLSFIIFSVVLSIGIYEYARYIYKEAGTADVNWIKGYYATIAGTRYINNIVLLNPVATQGVGRDGLFITASHNGERFVFPDDFDRSGYYNLEQAYDNFLTDMGLLGPGIERWRYYKITVTEWSSGVNANTYNPPWVDGKYRVEVTYQY